MKSFTRWERWLKRLWLFCKAPLPWWERLRLARMPRYSPGTVRLFDHEICFNDAASFLSTYRALYDEGIYEFKTTTARPFIIDCGAYIGLSVIYFKTLHPESDVLAFEPDPGNFALLKKNIAEFGFSGVTLRNEALWSEDRDLPFIVTGDDAGHVIATAGSVVTPGPTVKAQRLSKYIDRPVSFLKVDIEGAETNVVRECRGNLNLVERLFVEYHSFASEEQTLSELIGLLRDARFRVYIGTVDPQEAPFTFETKEVIMDLQLNIWAYRINPSSQGAGGPQLNVKSRSA
jgi:FkbM family methyltransferase